MTRRRLSGIALAALVLGAAFVAVNLHRRGHTTGDDWALYLRMAQSLFEGNVSDVITDNRFLYDHSTAVTPPIYPWGWPILLAPFVRAWSVGDTDDVETIIDLFGRLKLVEVAVFCSWLVLFHGIVRRRAGRIIALALTAVFATSYIYLVHTDQLLTEFPHMLAVAVAVWWLDRTMTRSRLTEARTSDLVILGLLIVAAYNFRREGLVLVAVVAAAQFVDVVHAWAPPRPAGTHVGTLEGGESAPYRRGHNPIGNLPWRRLLMPHLVFAAGAVVFQLMLPSTLVPDNGNSPSYIRTRLWKLDDSRNGNYPRQLVTQLGLKEPQVFGRYVLVAAALGAVIACIRSPRRMVPLAVLCGSTMFVIGTHFRMVARYYYQVTPLILFFVTMLFVNIAWLIVWAIRWVVERRRDWNLGTGLVRVTMCIAALPIAWLTIYHATDIPRRMDAAQEYNDAGRIQRGPAQPHIPVAMEAVEEYSGPDDVIVFYRARTMTLYTGRTAMQTTSFDNMVSNGDYFMQNRTDNYSQPVVTEEELLDAGFELVWQDATWRLWRIPDDGAKVPDGSPDVQPEFDSIEVGG